MMMRAQHPQHDVTVCPEQQFPPTEMAEKASDFLTRQRGEVWWRAGEEWRDPVTGVESGLQATFFRTRNIS
jgi:hypothetical protein